jgi:hypothetical protein
MMTSFISLSTAILWLTPLIGKTIDRLVRECAETPTAIQIRTAVNKAIPPLWEGMEQHNQKRSCFTCHNHGVSLVALATAKRHGFDVPNERIQEQIEYIVGEYDGYRERFKKGQGPGPSPTGGATDNTGYALFALNAVGYRPNDLTELVVSYTLTDQADRTYWATNARRMPTEASAFTTTALNIAALTHFASDSQRVLARERVTAARSWLLRTKPNDTEDRVFRLLGLKFANAEEAAIRDAARDLSLTQRDDGGWAQSEGRNSDAYATGSALYALRTAGQVANSDLRWRRGLAWLVTRQRDDGTWHVKSRSKPIQKYFESGFPHEKDQFISCAASAWSMAALALAVPHSATPGK